MSGAHLSERVCAFLRSKRSEVFAGWQWDPPMSDYVRFTGKEKVGRMLLNCLFVFRTIQKKNANSGQVESAHIVRIHVNHSHWMTDVHRLAPWRAPSRLTGWGTHSFSRKRITGSSFFAGDTSDTFLLRDGCYFWEKKKKVHKSNTKTLGSFTFRTIHSKRMKLGVSR